MKRNHHKILEYIHNHDEADIRELSKIMLRKHNDHRDFYGLTALLKEGYIEFTGPNCKEALTQAFTFQCYSQGFGQQTYKTVTVFGKDYEDAHFFIGPKGISYFHQRSEIRKGWFIAAALSVAASIISGITVAYITESTSKKTTTTQSSFISDKTDHPQVASSPYGMK